MLVSALISAFRSDARDEVQPYLWTDEDLLRYADEAQLSLVRALGGVPDTGSDACELVVTTGEEWVDIHPSILNVRMARLASDHSNLKIVNAQDLEPDVYNIPVPGEIHTVVLGEVRGKARLVNIPVADDTINLTVYRLPLATLVSESDTLDLEAIHREGLLYRMKEMAYSKQDADAFDPKAAQLNGEHFTVYCRQVKREQERLKAKPARAVVYGGL